MSASVHLDEVDVKVRGLKPEDVISVIDFKGEIERALSEHKGSVFEAAKAVFDYALVKLNSVIEFKKVKGNDIEYARNYALKYVRRAVEEGKEDNDYDVVAWALTEFLEKILSTEYLPALPSVWYKLFISTLLYCLAEFDNIIFAYSLSKAKLYIMRKPPYLEPWGG